MAHAEVVVAVDLAAALAVHGEVVVAVELFESKVDGSLEFGRWLFAGAEGALAGTKGAAQGLSPDGR